MGAFSIEGEFMTCSMIRKQCDYLGEGYVSFARKIGESPWMSLPFVSSGGIGAVLTCATKVAGCVTPFWHLWQTMFAGCTAVHSALISPLQSLPTKRTTFQSLIKSTLQVAWALRAGVINAILFDFFKHLSIGLIGPNRYLLCFWDVVPVVTILPVIANPICSFTTGMMIVGGVAVVSLASKYIGDKTRPIRFQELTTPIEQFLIPIDASSEFQAERGTFFDIGTRQYYFKPGWGNELKELVGKYQVQGEYRGMSIGLRMKLKNLKLPGQPEQLCDVVGLTKVDGQIAFEQDEARRRQERKTLLSIFFEQMENIRNCFALELIPLKSFRECMQNRIRKQEILANQLGSEIDALLKTVWKNAYSSFLVCGKEELLQLGYREEVAQKMHALILFYKSLPNEGPAPE